MPRCREMARSHSAGRARNAPAGSAPAARVVRPPAADSRSDPCRGRAGATTRPAGVPCSGGRLPAARRAGPAPWRARARPASARMVEPEENWIRPRSFSSRRSRPRSRRSRPKPFHRATAERWAGALDRRQEGDGSGDRRRRGCACDRADHPRRRVVVLVEAAEPERRVERHRHGAGEQRPEERRDEVRRGGQHQRDAVAWSPRRAPRARRPAPRVRVELGRGGTSPAPEVDVGDARRRAAASASASFRVRCRGAGCAGPSRRRRIPSPPPDAPPPHALDQVDKIAHRDDRAGVELPSSLTRKRSSRPTARMMAPTESSSEIRGQVVGQLDRTVAAPAPWPGSAGPPPGSRSPAQSRRTPGIKRGVPRRAAAYAEPRRAPRPGSGRPAGRRSPPRRRARSARRRGRAAPRPPPRRPRGSWGGGGHGTGLRSPRSARDHDDSGVPAHASVATTHQRSTCAGSAAPRAASPRAPGRSGRRPAPRPHTRPGRGRGSPPSPEVAPAGLDPAGRQAAGRCGARAPARRAARGRAGEKAEVEGDARHHRSRTSSAQKPGPMAISTPMSPRSRLARLEQVGQHEQDRRRGEVAGLAEGAPGALQGVLR